MTRGKVMIVGAAEAGKSTLIAALCPDAVNLEVRGRTVGFDHGTLRRGDDKVSIVGVPGQKRFAAVRESLSEGVLMAVWVHRAGERYCRETAAMMGQLAVPFVLFVNHHGTTGPARASETDEIQRQPSAVLWGDLHHPRPGLLQDIEDALWKVAQESAADR